MSYENKHLEDQGAPDGFDSQDCPLYQAYIHKKNIKQQIKQILENDDDGLRQAKQHTKRA